MVPLRGVKEIKCLAAFHLTVKDSDNTGTQQNTLFINKSMHAKCPNKMRENKKQEVFHWHMKRKTAL